jgi:hypothetical protein
MKAFCLALALVVAAAIAGAAAAKDFRPGDVRICNAKRCIAVENQSTLDALSAFYYGPVHASRVTNPRLGVLYYELRYTNGYVTGIVATAQLDRFLSYGVNLDQFQRGRWYRVPADAARGLTRLTVGLRPLRLSPTALAKTH